MSYAPKASVRRYTVCSLPQPCRASWFINLDLCLETILRHDCTSILPQRSGPASVVMRACLIVRILQYSFRPLQRLSPVRCSLRALLWGTPSRQNQRRSPESRDASGWLPRAMKAGSQGCGRRWASFASCPTRCHPISSMRSMCGTVSPETRPQQRLRMELGNFRNVKTGVKVIGSYAFRYF